jgi:hypothetical protein
MNKFKRFSIALSAGSCFLPVISCGCGTGGGDYPVVVVDKEIAQHDDNA